MAQREATDEDVLRELAQLREALEDMSVDDAPDTGRSPSSARPLMEDARAAAHP